MATIGIDLRPMQGLHKFRGIGVYINMLINSIGQIDKENHYVFFVFGSQHVLPDEIIVDANFSYEVRAVSTRIKNETLYKFISSWHSYAPLDISGIDVLLQPDLAFGVAKGRVPTVGVYYDAIPLIFPKQHFEQSVITVFKKGGLKSVLAHIMDNRSYSQTLKRYKMCQAIIAISKSAKNDLKKYVGYNKKITSIPLAANIKEHNISDPQGLKIPKDFVLYVGGGDYRKNVIDAVDAFKAINDQSPSASIVLVGRDFEDRQLNKLPTIKTALEGVDNVYRLGYIGDDDMAALYSHARLLLFPSRYEGFGMPVLEAMTVGCPVVAYSNSSIPEVVGGAFPLADNKQEFIKLAVKMFKDPETYVKKSKQQAQNFNWEHTARKTITLLEEIAT